MTKRERVRELGRPADTDSEQTRKNILTSAIECFSVAGYRKTSNRDIADRAGVTAATIYYYFKSKSELFIAAHRESQAIMLNIAWQALEGATSMIETWIQVTQEIFEYHDSVNMKMFNAFVRMEAKRNSEISEVLYDQDWRDFFHELAKIGVQSGELDPAKEREARAVMSALNFGLSHHGIESTLETHEECIDGMTNLFRGKLIKVGHH